jgi:hypothetical protein
MASAIPGSTARYVENEYSPSENEPNGVPIPSIDGPATSSMVCCTIRLIAHVATTESNRRS